MASQAESGKIRYHKPNLKIIHYNGDTLPDSAIPAMLEKMWAANVDILIYIGSRRRGSSIGKSHYGEDKYFHFWSGIDPGSSQKFYMEGISIFVTVRLGLAAAVIQERPINERLLQIRIRHPDIDCIITGGYALPMTKTFGKDKKYKDVNVYNTAREKFWHSFSEAMEQWGNRSTHIIGIDANGTVGGGGPGVGHLHPDEIDFNGSCLMDLMRAYQLAALNTHRCDTFFHGTHYHAPTKKWRRIDYVVVSDRLLQGDLIRYIGVRPVAGLATTRLDHLPITTEVDARLSRKYERTIKPEVNVLATLDTEKLADPELREKYELALALEFADYSHDRAITALLGEDTLSPGDADFARLHFADSVTIRNLWIEQVLQKWAEKLFKKTADTDLRRSMAWNWQSDYSKKTKELIFAAHASCAEMQAAATLFAVTPHANPNRILRRAATLTEDPLGSLPTKRPRVRLDPTRVRLDPPSFSEGGAPLGPPHLELQNLLPDFQPIELPSLPPGTKPTCIAELKSLALRAKEDQQAKKHAIRLDRIATVERITELVLTADSLKAKFHHAKLLMRRKGTPCLGATSYDEPELEMEKLVAHLQEPPRSVTQESPPTVTEELHREKSAQAQSNWTKDPKVEPTFLEGMISLVAPSLKQEKPEKSCLRGTSPAALLKLAGPSIVTFLTSLYKLACLLHFLPDSARDSTTILLPKAGTRDKFSFRLICLLHRIWTVFAGMIANALRRQAITPDTKAHDNLATAFGFLPGCGTRHVLLLVRAVIHTIQQRQLDATLLFLDLAKAFDSLDRSRFAEAFAELQIDTGWTCMVEELHTHTSYTISAFGHRFRCRTPRGVRQGSREGPLIFLLVFSVALRELGAYIGATHETIYAIYKGRRFDLLHITFADDTTLVLPTTNVTELGNIVIRISQIFKRYGLSLNWKKTVYMIICGKDTDHPEPGSPLSIPAQEGFPGAELTRVRSVTLVGQRIQTATGGFQGAGIVPVTGEMARRTQLSSAASIAVGHQFWRNSNLPVLTRLRFFEAFVLSILMYALETLPTLSENNVSRLERFQTRMLRKILMPAGEKVYRIEREKLRRQAGVASIRSLIRERRLLLFWDWALGPLDERIKAQGDPTSWPEAVEHAAAHKLYGFKPSLQAALELDGPFLTSCMGDLEHLRVSLIEQGACPSPTPTNIEDWKMFCQSMPRKDWSKVLQVLRTPVDEHTIWKKAQELPFACEYCPREFARAADKATHIRLAHRDKVESTIEYRVREALSAMLKDFPRVGCPACGRPFTPPNKDTNSISKEQHNVFLHHVFIFNKKTNETHAPCGTALLQYFDNPQPRGDTAVGPRHHTTVSPLRALSIRGLAVFKTKKSKSRYFAETDRAHNFKETATLSLKYLTQFWYGVRAGDIRSFLNVLRGGPGPGPGSGGGVGGVFGLKAPVEASGPPAVIDIDKPDPSQIGPSSASLRISVSDGAEESYEPAERGAGAAVLQPANHLPQDRAECPQEIGGRPAELDRPEVRRPEHQARGPNALSPSHRPLPGEAHEVRREHAQSTRSRAIGDPTGTAIPVRTELQVHQPILGQRAERENVGSDIQQPLWRRQQLRLLPEVRPPLGNHADHQRHDGPGARVALPDREARIADPHPRDGGGSWIPRLRGKIGAHVQGRGERRDENVTFGHPDVPELGGERLPDQREDGCRGDPAGRPRENVVQRRDQAQLGQKGPHDRRVDAHPSRARWHDDPDRAEGSGRRRRPEGQVERQVRGELHRIQQLHAQQQQSAGIGHGRGYEPDGINGLRERPDHDRSHELGTRKVEGIVQDLDDGPHDARPCAAEGVPVAGAERGRPVPGKRPEARQEGSARGGSRRHEVRALGDEHDPGRDHQRRGREQADEGSLHVAHRDSHSLPSGEAAHRSPTTGSESLQAHSAKRSCREPAKRPVKRPRLGDSVHGAGFPAPALPGEAPSVNTKSKGTKNTIKSYFRNQ